MNKEFAREIRNKNYEISDTGLFLPKQMVSIGGVFKHWVERDGVVTQEPEYDHNLMVNEGLDYVLDAAYSGGTPSTTWYLGIFKNDATLVGTLTSASHGAVTECVIGTDYTGAVRPTWSEAGVSSQTITNTASPATFPILTSITVYGALLTNVTTIAADSGGTWSSISKFAAGRSLINGDDLVVTYEITASDV